VVLARQPMELAGTTTLCHGRLYPPGQGLRIWLQHPLKMVSTKTTSPARSRFSLGKIQLKDRAKRYEEGIDKRGGEGRGEGGRKGVGTDIKGVSLSKIDG
jgi:hypothetical protein